MDSKIYSKPIRNENLKIDSLSMIGVYIYPLKYSTNITEAEINEIKNLHKDYVEKFIDISTYAYKFNRYIYNTQRIYLNSYTNENIKIEEQNPRYEVTKILVDTYPSGIRSTLSCFVIFPSPSNMYFLPASRLIVVITSEFSSI